MNKKPMRMVGPLAVLCFVSIFMVTRTEGFENIRTVQFLLIFVAGTLLGLVIGILRFRRGSSPT